MSPFICPFYGELSSEEAEMLRVPHGTPVKLVKEFRKVRRIMRLVLRAASAAIVMVAVAIVVVVLI